MGKKRKPSDDMPTEEKFSPDYENTEAPETAVDGSARTAVAALESLLESKDESIRLQAAQTILVHAREGGART